ncbi:MAG TPA: FtsX-like permease family protein, partial [Dehalococcoidia bacterium]
MNEFFGIDMTYIMIALLCVLAVALSTVIYVFLRNRVIFNIGVRNIPRRRAQTVLIIIGLMLSTVIISAALSIGDTADYSITNSAFSQLHSVDEAVSARTDVQSGASADNAKDGDDGTGNDDALNVFFSAISPQPIPGDRADELVESFRDIDGVDGAMKVLRGSVSVTNVTKKQSESFAVVVGIPDDVSGFESDFDTLDGRTIAPSTLAPGEILANEEAAKKLDIEPGDQLQIYANNQPHTFTVKAINHDRVLTGSVLGQTFGFSLPYDEAASVLSKPDQADMIVVSNDGGVRDGMSKSEQVTNALNKELEGTPWQAGETKRAFVDLADMTASIFTTFFAVLGLFSIAAGVMLIFLIFVMLAAERKVEMGMVRAIGTKRSHLVQMFMSEGMVYNVAAAAVGCALGIVVSIGMVRIMAMLFGGDGLDITFHVTARSLIVAYSIGVALTFLTVTFASWRVGNLNIVSAIRDLSDPVTTNERPAHGSGFGRVFRYVMWLLFKPENWGAFFRAIGLIIAGAFVLAGGIALFIAATQVYGSGAAGGVIGVLMAVFGGLLIVAGVALVLVGLSRIFQMGPLMLIAGPIAILYGWNAAIAFFFGAGISLVIIGAALLVRFIGASARPVFTAMGLLILFFWLLFAGENVPGIKDMSGDIDMFFLSGVTMVLAGTFVLVYNADLLLGLLTLSGGLFSSIVPSIKTAVAYPLAAKFRTGMTIAMISLVMFALVMFSTMNGNFTKLFDSDDALAGYEVVVTENSGNPIDDLPSALRGSGYATDAIEGVDKVAVANGQISKFEQLNVAAPDQHNYPILGMSQGFRDNNQFTFQARAKGYDSDEAVREALRDDPNAVVIDAFAVGGGFGPSGVLEGVSETDTTFDAIPLRLINSS